MNELGLAIVSIQIKDAVLTFSINITKSIKKHTPQLNYNSNFFDHLYTIIFQKSFTVCTYSMFSVQKEILPNHIAGTICFLPICILESANPNGQRGQIQLLYLDCALKLVWFR